MSNEKHDMNFELKWIYARYGNGDGVADILVEVSINAVRKVPR